MAVNTQELAWSRIHFTTRLFGLIGAAITLVLLVLEEIRSVDALVALFRSGTPTLLYTAVGFVGLALLVEFLALLSVAAGRRNILGLGAMLQVFLAVALLVGINVYSFQHPMRFDLTYDHAFTLPEDVREQLVTLQPGGDTRILVYQVHKAFAGADKPDLYDTAAERKIVEKVTDLVALLREFGSSLRVDLLDVQEKGYQDKLDRLTQGNDELRAAIESAPENSIFIVGAGRIQQMSFNEFYLLDRAASKEGRGNLVLLGQGSDGRGTHPFVRRILNLEQRRPRVGVLTIHELLTTEGADDTFTLAGLRKTLTLNGFDVKDVVLKKGWERGGNLEPAADTFEESKLERLEAELDSLQEDIRDLEEERKSMLQVLDDLRVVPGENTEAKLKQLTAKYGRLFLGGKVTERGREILRESITRDLASVGEELATAIKERDKLQAERVNYDVDQVAESRRLTDVKAKLSFALADCDLVIVPRLTRQSQTGQLIIPRLYRLSEEQVSALRDFVKAGKPMLVCPGPTNEPPGLRLPPELGPPGPDGLELMLTQAGFRLGKHTVLFPTDTKAFVERRQDLLRQSTPVEVPPLDFDAPVPSTDAGVEAAPGPEHPLRAALRVLARSAGSANELRLRFPRPVSWVGPADKGGAFLVTATGWNEARPFPSAEWRPRYTPAKADDPDTGTPDARRRGAFSVAAAGEATLEGGQPSRIAVIGQGEVFHGAKLDPARERLLLVTTHWLLGRDDYLPTDEHPWQYPRLGLTPEDREHELWLWGSRLGLPIFFAFLGAVVLLFRRLR